MATVTVVTAERTLEIEASSIVSGVVNSSGHLILTRHDGQPIDAGAISGMKIFDGTSYVKADTFAYVGGQDPGVVPDGSVWYDTNEPAGPFASDIQKGLVELADSTETIAGADSTRAVTPAGMAAVTATDSRRGLVELATTAEASTGTDTTRAVTPAGLKAVADTKQASDTDLTAIAALAAANDDVIQRKSGAWTNRTMSQLATDLAATGEFPDIRLHNGTSYVDADTANVYIGSVDPGAVANGSVWFDTTP